MSTSTASVVSPVRGTNSRSFPLLRLLFPSVAADRLRRPSLVGALLVVSSAAAEGSPDEAAVSVVRRSRAGRELGPGCLSGDPISAGIVNDRGCKGAADGLIEPGMLHEGFGLERWPAPAPDDGPAAAEKCSPRPFIRLLTGSRIPQDPDDWSSELCLRC